jgi:undecaprenyl-diphosphatase
MTPPSPSRRRRALAIAALGYGLLGLLAILVAAGGPVAGLDRLAADWAAGLRGDGSGSPWLLVTALGGGAAAGAVMATVSLMLLRAGEARVLLAQWGGFLLARLVTDGLKLALSRARPEMTDLERLLAGATNYAFPSGHATSAAYVYGFIALLMLRSHLPGPGRWAILALAVTVIAAIALSRIVLGVHFASDVAGGLLSGLAALAVASHGVRRDMPWR